MPMGEMGMKVYAYRGEDGRWYAGRSPTGRVKWVNLVTNAVLFSSECVETAEDCEELGLDLYVMDISEPTLVRSATGPAPENKSSFDMESFEVHPMDLFRSE